VPTSPASACSSTIRNGFALTDILKAGGGAYPVATTDGGQTDERPQWDGSA
jgi:hypothetical protein